MHISYEFKFRCIIMLQVYTVCAQGYPASRESSCRAGVLQVRYPDPRPETVFESGELGAEAVTGMWGLRRDQDDPHHSLVVLSFVGGTRALQLEGTALMLSVLLAVYSLVFSAYRAAIPPAKHSRYFYSWKARLNASSLLKCCGSLACKSHRRATALPPCMSCGVLCPCRGCL